MEEDGIDPFSSLSIQSKSPPHINSSPRSSPNHSIFESIPDSLNLKRQKLKPRRKGNKLAGSNQSLDTSSCYYKLKVKYDGFFKPIKNGTQQKYCFGKLKILHLDPISYTFGELLEELSRIRHLHENQILSLCFLDKSTKLFISLKDDNSFRMMLAMYEEEKEILIYVTILDKDIPCDPVLVNMHLREQVTLQNEGNGEENHFNYEEGSDFCHSESSYHSLHSSDEDGLTDLESEREIYSYDKDKPIMEVGAQYPDVIAFRRALNHFALTTDFEYFPVKSDPTRVKSNSSIYIREKI